MRASPLVRHPTRVRAPRTQPSELLPGQTRAEHFVAHEFLRRGLLDDVRLDAHVAKDLHGALLVVTSLLSYLPLSPTLL